MDRPLILRLEKVELLLDAVETFGHGHFLAGLMALQLMDTAPSKQHAHRAHLVGRVSVGEHDH